MVAETGISAPVDAVWRLVTDITLMPRFSTELQRVRWADGFDAPGLGVSFTGDNRNPAVGEWTTTSTIVEFDPPRIFGWAVGDPRNPAATWRFEIIPDAGVASTVRYTAQIGPGPSGVTMLIERQPDRAEAIVAGRIDQLSAAMAVTLAAIKRIAERGESSSAAGVHIPR